MYRKFNPNPCGKKTGDCVIRGISIFLDKKWDEVYTELGLVGLKMCDMPNSNSVWHRYLLDEGCKCKMIEPITVKQFCETHPSGKYLLATGTHVIAVIDGDYYDAWNSGSENIFYYYTKEEN